MEYIIYLDSENFIKDIGRLGNFFDISLKNILINAIDAYLKHSIFPPINQKRREDLEILSLLTYLDNKKIVFRPMQVDTLRLTVVQDIKWKTEKPPYLFINNQRVEYKLLLVNNQLIRAYFVRDGGNFYWMSTVGKVAVPKIEIIGWDFID